MLLVKPHMPDRTKGRGQKKTSVWFSRLGFWRVTANPTQTSTVTKPPEPTFVTENAVLTLLWAVDKRNFVTDFYGVF
jgi:hypothetical protein